MTRERQEELLEELIDSEGFNDLGEFLEVFALEACVPGICTEPDCGYTTFYEPDQECGWCEDCGKNTVVSGLILAGII